MPYPKLNDEIGMSSQKKTNNLKQSQPIKPNPTQSQSKAVEPISKTRDELEWLKKFYQSLPALCFTINGMGIVLEISRFGIAYLGYDQQDLVKKSLKKIFYWQDKIICESKLSELQKEENQVSQWQARIVCKNGEIRWVRVRASLVNGTECNPIISLVCEDIHDSKIAEEKLERSLDELRWQEALLRAMAGASPLAFYVVDNRTDAILYFNPRFCEIWGIKHLEEQMQDGQLKNNDIIPYCLPLITNIPAFAESCQPLQSEQNRDVIEDEINFTDGRTIRRFSAQIQDESDRYFGRLYIFEDISERKSVEEALKLANFSFERFAIPAFWLNSQGSILRVNEAACETLSYCRYQLQSMHFYDINPDFPASVWDQHWPILKQQKTLTLISRYRTKQNKIIPVEITFNYLEFNGEEYNFAFGRDITDRLHTEAELLHQSLALASFSSNLKQIHRLNTAKYNSCEELFGEYIKTGCGILQLPIGIISQIEGESYLIRAVQSDCEFLVPGLELELQNTSCAAVVKAKKTIAYHDVAEIEEMPDHPIYQRLKLAAYIGTPIVVNQQIYGTLSFASTQARRSQFETYEREIIELMAQSIGSFIATYQAEIERQQASEALRHKLLREKLVGAIAQRIRQSLKLENILKATVNQVRQALETDRVVIFRFQPDCSGNVVVESVDQRWSSILETDFYDHCFQEADILPYQQGQVKAIEDIYTANLNHFQLDLLAKYQVRAKLVVPILRAEQLWGILIIHHCSAPRQWQKFEIEMLFSLLSQVEIAIQQAELYEQSRTATAKALSQAHQLEQTLQKLQKTQAQLVHSEKMSSLGHLVAGLAHEINNPVSFIYGNLVYANEYCQDILSLVQLYQKQYPQPTPEIQSKIEAIELDFLRDDLPKLLASMKNGADRICGIVSSLRNFSRLSEAEIKAVDIHAGIESTLTLLQNRLKAQGRYPGIEIIKEYAHLPQVECYAGQLNQVFMNLLVNAIDAIQESLFSRSQSAVKYKGIIRIRTELINSNQVAIRISDNGLGISEEAKTKLFDPFFTTKPVGAGTGLGLSISYQIVVEKHGGQLYYKSELDKGAEFVIQIPLRQEYQTASRSH